MASRQRTDKPCEDCGTLMMQVTLERRLCYDCARKRQREYQRKYSKAQQEKRKANGIIPQETISNPNKKYCKGCAYWGAAYKDNACCNYIFVEGHSRPCPPGKGCTEKIVGKRKKIRDFVDDWGAIV